MEFIALTQGINIPSARFRVRQLINPLRSVGHYITEIPSKPTAYPPVGLMHRISWAGRASQDAILRALQSRKYKATILQRELISTIPSFESLLRKPLIVDIDDAIWLHRRGLAARNLARLSNHIVAGNSYIAEYFSKYTKNITIIPTAVDIERFSPHLAHRITEGGVIGWSGTASGLRFFRPEIVAGIKHVLDSHPKWRLRIVSNQQPTFSGIPSKQIEYIPWSPDAEAQLTREMTIGIMPLDQNEWSLGKCSYKMLLYMACGIPVVVSDVGMNSEVLRQGNVGIGINTPSDWSDALKYLIENPIEREKMGDAGRKVVEDHYSISVVTSLWAKVLSDFGQPSFVQ